MRVLVTLNADVLVDEDSDGDGRQGYPWKIKGQDPTPTPWTGGVATGFASGTGTETDPYMIETAEQLAYLASSTNSGTTYDGKYIALGADIDLGGVQAADGTWSGKQWTPIGTYSNQFKGIFNGNGYSISNIYMNESDDGYQGLFGYAQDCGFENVYIESGYFVSQSNTAGGLCGVVEESSPEVKNEITNCINKALISSEDRYYWWYCRKRSSYCFRELYKLW